MISFSGTGLLPGPIEELHAIKISSNIISIQWSPPSDTSNITGYIVYYQKVDNTSAYETPLKLKNVRLFNYRHLLCD